MYLGHQTGRVIKSCSLGQTVLRLSLLAGCLSLLGGGLAGFQPSGGLIPLNKNVWSLSFCLLSGGLGIFTFLLFYLAIDVAKWSYGWPFTFVGMNSIAVYTLHEVFGKYFPFSYQTDQSHQAVLTSNYIAMASACLLAYWMYAEAIFIKL